MGLEEQIRHEKCVDELNSRLSSVGRYSKLWRHYEYVIENKRGECDVLTYSDKGFLTYYEVKGHKCTKSYDRAIAQFQKFKTTHPLVKTRFVYVTPTGVKRVYL